jgi:hypothetical protein
MTEPVTIKTETVKRITATRIVQDIKSNIAAFKTPGKVARVTFHVTSIVTEESPMGAYPRLIGDFKSVNLISGDILRSGTAVLPSVISDPILKARSEKNAPNVTGQYDLLSAADGTFTVSEVIPAAERSVLDMLEEAEGPAA